MMPNQHLRIWTCYTRCLLPTWTRWGLGTRPILLPWMLFEKWNWRILGSEDQATMWLRVIFLHVSYFRKHAPLVTREINWRIDLWNQDQSVIKVTYVYKITSKGYQCNPHGVITTTSLKLCLQLNFTNRICYYPLLNHCWVTITMVISPWQHHHGDIIMMTIFSSFIVETNVLSGSSCQLTRTGLG